MVATKPPTAPPLKGPACRCKIRRSGERPPPGLEIVVGSKIGRDVAKFDRVIWDCVRANFCNFEKLERTGQSSFVVMRYLQVILKVLHSLWPHSADFNQIVDLFPLIFLPSFYDGGCDFGVHLGNEQKLVEGG